MGRRKGEGSKYKRTINGKTFFVYEITKNGKKVSAYSPKSYAEAHRKLMTKLEHSITGEKILMKDLVKRWLAYKEGTVKAQTLQLYTQYMDCHIIPELGEQYVHQISVEDIESFYNSLSTHPATIRRLNAVIGALFKYAIKHKHTETFPAKDIDLPSVDKKPIKVLTKDECYHLLECAKGSRLYLPARVALETGMRRGEILGLRYEDVHDCSIHVERTVIQLRDRDTGLTRMDFNSPKNRQTRVISITPELERELLKGNEKGGLIFTSPRAKTNQSIWSLVSFTNSWILFRKKAGFPTLRFHDLRHTHISHLFDLGVSLPIISQRAGHKNITTTLNIYTHVVNQKNDIPLLSFAQ